MFQSVNEIVIRLLNFKDKEAKDGIEKEMKERLCLFDVDAYPHNNEPVTIYENLLFYFGGIESLLALLNGEERMEEIRKAVEYIKENIVDHLNWENIFQKNLAFKYFSQLKFHLFSPALFNQFSWEYYHDLRRMLEYNYKYSSNPLNFKTKIIKYFFLTFHPNEIENPPEYVKGLFLLSFEITLTYFV